MRVDVILWVRADCPYCNAVQPRLEIALRRLGVELITRNMEFMKPIISENALIIDPESGEVIDKVGIEARGLYVTPFLELRVYGDSGDMLTIMIPGLARYAVTEGGERVFGLKPAVERYVENITELVRNIISGRGRQTVRITYD
jgi:hypothetical protein